MSEYARLAPTAWSKMAIDDWLEQASLVKPNVDVGPRKTQRARSAITLIVQCGSHCAAEAITPC